MNKFFWSSLLEDKQKAKCGGVDKSQLYMRFTLIYLVFCIVYHLFWHFYVCFYLVGDVQVEGSKNEQSEAKRSQKKQFWAKYENIDRKSVV